MMREGRDTVASDSRSEMVVHGERIGERERSTIQHLGAEERGTGMAMMRGNGDEQLGNFRHVIDQCFSLSDNDASSKFQWTYLLKGSGNAMVNGVDSGQVPYGRRHDGLVEKSIPVDSETIRNAPIQVYNLGNAEYRRVTGNVTRHSVEDSEYHRRIRNATDLRGEDYRHTRNMSGLPIGDANDSNGCTRNMTSCPVEIAEYNGSARTVMTGHPVENAEHPRHSRTVMTGHPVENAEYPRHSRTVATGHPLEDATYQRLSRTVTGLTAEDDGRFLVKKYPQHMVRHISLTSYDEGNSRRYRNEDSSRSLTPHSQSNDQHIPVRGSRFTNLESPHEEVFHHFADALSTDDSIPPSGCCSSHGRVYSKAGTSTCHNSCTAGTSLRADYNPNVGRHVEYISPQSQSSGKVYRTDLSEDTCYKYENLEDYNARIDVFGNDVMDPALPRYRYIGNPCEVSLEENGLHRSNHSLKEAPFVAIDDMNWTAHEYERFNMESMDSYLEYPTHASHESRPCEEECHYEFDAHGASHGDQTWNYLALEDGNPRQKMEPGDNDLYDQPRKKPKRKHGFVENMSGSKHRTSTLGGRGDPSYDNRHLTVEPEDDFFDPNMRLSHHRVHLKENAEIYKTEPKLPFGGLSKELQSRLSQPYGSGSNRVKNRLKHSRFVPRLHGPPAKFLKGNVSNCVKSSLNVNHSTYTQQTYGRAVRSSVKKRLKPGPYLDVCPPDPQVSHSGLNLESQQKVAPRNPQGTKEAGLSQESDPDPSILKVNPTEKDPPENSQELKCQADHWFLKCMLYLNANPGRQKKFKGLGSGGTLKCIICSSSKEFIQTKDVATHAFTSLKVGLRAPHLGFHRALCVLMGWDPAVASNGRWVCKSLPDVEACALKEDIIVWPPVFIIHNGFFKDSYNNDQRKISIEQIENILRDMGLSEGKTTVSQGKSGSSIIMLVKFNATLSGLQEAERLHNVFAEKKHGRADLKEMNAGVGCSKEGVAQDKIENVLYGYLGTIEDFDKLNFDMRRRYVAKSKKEILARV